MPNAVVMTGYGPPEVLKWIGVPLTEPGEGQIRIKVKAAGGVIYDANQPAAGALKLPFAAIPRPLPGRKELPCPTRL